MVAAFDVEMIVSFDLCLGVEQKPNIRVGRSSFIIQSYNILKDAYQNFNQTSLPGLSKLLQV
jgi:hypothetical protein